MFPKASSERGEDFAGEPLHTDGRGMEEGEALLPQPAKQPPSKRYANEVLYGIINAIVGAPTMISFAAIVYQVRLLAACLCCSSWHRRAYCRQGPLSCFRNLPAQPLSARLMLSLHLCWNCQVSSHPALKLCLLKPPSFPWPRPAVAFQ